MTNFIAIKQTQKVLKFTAKVTLNLWLFQLLVALVYVHAFQKLLKN